jgi:hypothetical protein
MMRPQARACPLGVGLARQYAGHAAQFKKPAPKTAVAAIGTAQPRRRLVRRVGGLRTVGLARPLLPAPRSPRGRVPRPFVGRGTAWRRLRSRAHRLARGARQRPFFGALKIKVLQFAKLTCES